VTSIAFATVVVTLGVAWLLVTVAQLPWRVQLPFSTSMGFAVFTPEKLTIPPTAALKP
jgi:hypothetical protein